MSQTTSSSERDPLTLKSGVEALQTSPEFRGPVESMEGHHCNDHFALLYESRAEQLEAIIPFLRQGIERGERCLYVIDELSAETVLSALRRGGVDVDAVLESGQLSFHSVGETYLRNGTFEPDEMIDFYAETVEEATADFPALRIVAETTWLQEESATFEKFMEYESKINELFDGEDCIALCQYDRAAFDPEDVQNIIQTHPHLIYDGAVCNNVYYTPPEEFFDDDAPARENDRMLRTLRERTVAKDELRRHKRSLENLYDVTAETGPSFETKMERLLALGSDRFGLDIGYFTRTTDDGTFDIVSAVGDHDEIQPGVTDSVCDTYCEKLLASPGTVAVRDAADEGWTDDPAYERFGLDAYFATTVHVGGEEYGTLCFASEAPRDRPYTDSERAFLDLMGQWVEYELERQRREVFLRESYRITSDPALGFDDKLQALFELGCEQFGLDLGAMAEVDPDEDRFEIEYVSGDHEQFVPGFELPLSETYCTAAADCGGIASVDDPVAAGFDDIRVHREFGIKAYLGTYIEVEGGVNRTFFFVSEESRDHEFSDDERTFARLLGQWVKYELERQQREEFLRESYQITADPDLAFEEKLERLLDLGREWMDLDAAGLTHLPEWGGKFLNEFAVGYGDGPTWTDPDPGHYCREVLESDEPVGKADVRGTDWADDPIHREHGLTSYLGTKVMNGATPYGTLWVGSSEPRDREFTETERTFLELIGQWVSYEVERREQHGAQQKLYELTSDPDLGFEEKLDGLFELGCAQFGLELGGVAKVDPDADYFEVEHISGDHPHLSPGAQVDLSETYCRVFGDEEVSETAIAEPVGITDPEASGFDDELCVAEFGVRTYLGTRLRVDGGSDRTFFFVATEPRDDPIADEERTFLRLMAQWVKYEFERRQRERKLRERTEHLNAIIETTPECIKTVAPDGTLLQMNSVGLDMVEAPSEEAVTGESVYDLIAPEDLEAFREFNERICAGERGTMEFDIVGLEGTRRHMETHAAPLERPDGTTVQVALTRDITEQVEREHELERALDLLEKTEHIADVGGWEIDTATSDVFWSENLFELLGIDADEELPLDEALDLYHEEDRADVEGAIERAIESVEPFDVEARIRTGDDEMRWLRIQGVPETVDGEVVTLRGAAQDITEQKERKRALRESKEQLRALIEVLPVGVVVAEADGELVKWNDATEEIWGGEIFGAESIAEYDVYDGWWEDTGEPVEVDEWPLARALDGEEVTEPDAIEIEGFDGERRTVLMHGMPVRDEDGEVSRAVITQVDITERKENERFQRELYEITAAPDLDFEEKLDRLLELGRERFGLENGYFNRVDTDADEFEVVAAVGPHDMIEPGAVDSLTDTYCGEHLDTAEPLAVADASEAGLDDLRACTEYELDAYFAATVHVGSEEYGTLCFASETPRDKPFTDAERTFIDLMSQWVSYEVERRERSKAQHELYEITADPDLETEEKIDRLLDVGCDHLDLSIGMLTREREQASEILQMRGTHPDLDEGTLTPQLTDKYCRRVVDTGESISVADAERAGWDGDALYRELDLQCYAGTEVTVDGAVYGTLCFTDLTPRRTFTDTERSFLDLMGRCVSYELERSKREERLHVLSTLGRELLDTETAADVATRSIELLDEMFETPVGAIALYDDQTGGLDLAAQTEAASRLPTETLIATGDGIGWDAFVSAETQRASSPFDDGSTSPSVSEIVAYPLGTHGVLLLGSTQSNEFHEVATEAVRTAATSVQAALDRADREQQLQEREETLEEQNQTLSRLNRINDTIRSIDQALVEADTRKEIERVVCEELADIGPYELAWIGEHDGVSREITPVESAGNEAGYLENIEITTDDAPEGRGPSGRAVKTGEPQVVNNVLTDESFAPWRQDALKRGYHATAAFPLAYRDTQYGVLNLYAAQPGVFDDLEREVLTELSSTIAYAINAVESKKALISDEFTELEFEIDDLGMGIVDLVRATDCEFAMETIVPRSDGGLRGFFTTRGIDAETFREYVPNLPVTELSVVSERVEDGEPVILFDAAMEHDCLAMTALEHGGKLTRLEAADDTATATITLAADAEVREFVEMFRTKYPEAALTAQRTQERSPQTKQGFRSAVLEELTPRQLEVIQTAYYNGYFEEPRTRTASEIAETLDISQPTFTSHARKAQRKLFRHLFDEEPIQI